MLGHIPDAAERSWQQGVTRVGKLGLNFQRPGFGIHLIECVGDMAGKWELRVVGQEELELRTGLLTHKGTGLLLAHFEAEPDGVQRDNRGERLRRIRIHQPSHGNLCIADQAADGCVDRTVFQVQLGGFQRPPLCLDFASRGLNLGFGGQLGLLDVGLVGRGQ